MKIRVVLAEDQAMVRGALAALLAIEADLEVVAQCANGREGLAAVEALHPDVLITDVEMPLLSGLDLAEQVLARAPRTRVVILTTFARPGFFRRAMEAGARGYLLKERPASELAEAVRRVHKGMRAVDPELSAEAWAEENPLTARERAVLALAAEGQSSASIAAALGLSEGTIRNYLSEAIQKLGAANRIDAGRMARAKGWL